MALCLYVAPLPAAPPNATEDIEASEKLFNEGKELMFAERFLEACERLAKSYQLKTSGRTILYLGACHKVEGKKLIAWSELQEAARVARLDKRKDREDAALNLLDELSKESPKVSLDIKPATAALNRLEVVLDGVPIDQEHWRVGVPVSPGTHVIVVSAPHCVDEWVTVNVNRTAATVVAHIPELRPSLKVLFDVVPSAPATSALVEPKRAESSKRNEPAERNEPTKRETPRLQAMPTLAARPPASPPGHPLPADLVHQGVVGVAFSGLGLFGLVVGPLLGARASGLRETANASCPRLYGCSNGEDALHKDAARYSDLSAASLVIGGIAAAAGGITLTVFGVRRAQTPVGTALAKARFSLQAGSQGVVLGGQF